MRVLTDKLLLGSSDSGARVVGCKFTRVLPTCLTSRFAPRYAHHRPVRSGWPSVARGVFAERAGLEGIAAFAASSAESGAGLAGAGAAGVAVFSARSADTIV